MAQFEPMKGEIEAAGGLLIYVAAEKKNGMFNPQKFLTEHPISFPFALDEDRAVTKAYGIYQWIGVDAFNIARPATFVIGRDGIIRYIYVGASQLDRAPMDTVLNELRRAAQ